MLIKLVLHLLLYTLVSSQHTNFTFNGFRSNNLMSLDGTAKFTPNGLLMLTNTTTQQDGHAFYSNKINLKNNSYIPNGTSQSVSSFTTTFVFAIIPKFPVFSANGLAFVIAPTRGLPNALAGQYLGLFNNKTNDGNDTNHVFAVELDTAQNVEFGDINSNHVGIDINSLKSNLSRPAGYYRDSNGEFENLTLISGHPMQVWVEYDGLEKRTNVTLAPLNIGKPKRPLLSLSCDLSPIINQEMFVGFSSSGSTIFFTSHYVLGWSFMVNGMASGLDLSQLPKLPRVGPKEKSNLSIFLTIGMPLIMIFLMSVVISGIAYYVWRKWKFAEVLEDWEHEYGPHRFKYKDLYVATKGFKEKELLGIGGFGRVYRGVFPSSNIEVAVKRVSHESRQGMREFIAEIVSIGRLRHRNIVPLLGYCRRKGELLLVYDYMPNGSLDKFLYDQPNFTLNWSQRFWVVKGVAAGLNYLHQEWEKVVIHRDVKASNVLLDSEFNGRLGDFGLAKLYDHGADPQTTRIVGTIGYLAPEQSRTGKATTSTDVYSFGAFLLEVACGRRPIKVQADENIILVDQVVSCWSRGEIVQAVDPNLGGNYVVEEVELVLKLGLLCSNLEPVARPSMQQVVQYLEGYVQLPELSPLGISATDPTFKHHKGFGDSASSYPSSTEKAFSYETTVVESLLSGGR